MKAYIFAVIFLVGSVTACFAQQTDSVNSRSQNVRTQNGKAKIKIEELPEPVKQALEDTTFKGWMINAAFRDERKQRYEVELKNGVEKQVVKFNKDGKRLDD